MSFSFDLLEDDACSGPPVSVRVIWAGRIRLFDGQHLLEILRRA